MGVRYSIILGFMGQIKDRFSVYHEARGLAEKLDLVRQVDGVTGVEMVYPNEIEDVDLVREALAERDLRISAVNVNLKGDARWHRGALTATDAATRREAVRWIQTGMDLAADLGAGLVTMCPLADGHDYPFATDYRQSWRHLIEGLRAAADHRPDVRLSLEYKPSEPRARVILSTVGKSLYACAQVDRPNVGVTLDVGHALYAGESFAESVELLADAGKLFLAHGNDNDRGWDWDLIPGSVNFWDLIEGTYALNKVGYDGWHAFDVFPARLDPVAAMRASLRMCALAESLVAAVGQGRLADAIERGDPVAALALFQDRLEQSVVPEATAL
jgi:xylose isomerase